MATTETIITPLNAEETRKAEAVASVNPYFIRVLIALDMLLNVILGGRLCETMSARTGRAALEGKLWGIWMAKFLNLFQKDHVILAVASDVEHAKQVEGLDDKSGAITE